MLDRTLVTFVSVALLVALTVGMMDLLVPFLLRAEFDAACRSALFRMDALGGLPEVDQYALVEELCAAGFTDVSILATEGAPFGAPLVLEVRAIAPVRRVVAGLIERKEGMTLCFRKQTTCRRIATYPGEAR